MIYAVTVIISLLFLFFALVTLKKRRVDFKYAFIWLIINVLIIILSLNTKLLDVAAEFLDVLYPPALLFAGALIFVLVFIFYITIYVSDLKQRVIRLTQEIAILKSKVDKGEEN